MRRWSILGHRRPAAAVHGPPSLLPATVLVYGCEFSVRGAAPEREGGSRQGVRARAAYYPKCYGSRTR